MNNLEPVRWDFLVEHYSREFLLEINHECQKETTSKILAIISSDAQLYKEFVFYLIIQISNLIFKEGETQKVKERFLTDLN